MDGKHNDSPSTSFASSLRVSRSTNQLFGMGMSAWGENNYSREQRAEREEVEIVWEEMIERESKKTEKEKDKKIFKVD